MPQESTLGCTAAGTAKYARITAKTKTLSSDSVRSSR